MRVSAVPPADRDPLCLPPLSVRGRPNYYSSAKYEYAHVRFDLAADLSSLFDWNTKQAFLFLYATYSPTQNHSSYSSSSSPLAPSPNPHISEAVIWDSIICAPTSPYAFSPADFRELLSPRYIPYIERWSLNPRPKYKRSERQKLRERARCPPTASVKTSFEQKIALRNQRAKYSFQDFGGSFEGMGEVRLRLGWNVQPWVGALRWGTLEGGIKNVGVEWPLLPGSGKGEESTKAKVELRSETP